MNLLAAAGSTDAIIGDSPAMQEVFKSIGRVASTDGSSDPAALLWRLNHYLVENTSHHFVTMFLAVIDPLGGQLVYASAGHPASLLEAGGQTQQLEVLSIPRGIDSGLTQSTSRVVLISPGSLLLLATEGVFEAHSPGDELLGVDRLLKIVIVNWDQSALAISERLQREVQDFSDSSLHDDVTTVVLVAYALSAIGDKRKALAEPAAHRHSLKQMVSLPLLPPSCHRLPRPA